MVPSLAGETQVCLEEGACLSYFTYYSGKMLPKGHLKGERVSFGSQQFEDAVCQGREALVGSLRQIVRLYHSQKAESWMLELSLGALPGNGAVPV